MPKTETYMSIAFVEDPNNHTIHCWLTIGTSALGPVCEQVPVGGQKYKTLDATEIQEDWFDRLCPVCFKEEG